MVREIVSYSLGIQNESMMSYEGNPILIDIWAEAVNPREVQISSFTVQQTNLSRNLEKMQFNLDQAEYLRELAFIRMIICRNKMSQIFNSPKALT